MPDLRVIEIFIVGGGTVNLQNLRAQVAHIDPTGNRIGAIHRIFKHDVRITRLKLDLGQPLEEFAGVNVFFAHAFVGHQFVIPLTHGDITERFAVNPFHVIR